MFFLFLWHLPILILSDPLPSPHPQNQKKGREEETETGEKPEIYKQYMKWGQWKLTLITTLPLTLKAKHLTILDICFPMYIV